MHAVVVLRLIVFAVSKEKLSCANTTFGTAAQSYFRTLLMDINGVKETTDRGGALNLISNYKIAAVAANIRVALLQPTSYVRAMYIVKPKHLISALMVKKNAKICMLK